MLPIYRCHVAAIVLLSCLGCSQPQAPVSPPKSGGVVRGDSIDLPLYNKASGQKVVDFSSFPEDIQMMWKQIDPSPHIEAFKEKTGHYPADFAEFKSGIIEPKNLKFPSKLPGGMQLQYDEANHKVVAVKAGKGTR